MKDRAIDRRDFHKMTTAALSGIAAGAVLGCRKGGEPVMMRPPENAVAAAELHLCRGLNECKGKGKSGDNDCRGQGTCATAKAAVRTSAKDSAAAARRSARTTARPKGAATCR